MDQNGTRAGKFSSMPSINSERLIGLAKNGCPWIRRPGLRHKRRQKDNRYSMQCGIGLNASGDFTAIRFRHCDIEEDKVRLNVLGCLMSFVRIVLFTDEIAASRFQSALVRKVISRLVAILHI